ncbi:16S rRNA (guanine(527)-N(7))-methyltransferase RsmG [Paenibacillus sp. y28]|uniref:16S rRNA (guanine(527)-N(7))-methyltransferase RsmG n=1 Tax=Paenibacillus sp. y28 TaxID=3129110 RepID=UPI003016D683
MDSIQQQFVSLLAEKGIDLTAGQLEQFEVYYRTLVEWNEKMNLTAITEREQVYMKHFYDSLSLSFFVPISAVTRIADIGSGAGFPSLPLKIAFPHLQVTIVDSLNKRIQFLTHLAAELGLQQVECIHGRAEEIARKDGLRDSFDLVTARAVARLSVLNEFCLPFVKPRGSFVAMKGSEIEEELSEAANSLKELKGAVQNTVSFELPSDQSKRHLIFIQKQAATPKKYPRKPGTPLKSPL